MIVPIKMEINDDNETITVDIKPDSRYGESLAKHLTKQTAGLSKHQGTMTNNAQRDRVEVKMTNKEKVEYLIIIANRSKFVGSMILLL